MTTETPRTDDIWSLVLQAPMQVMVPDTTHMTMLLNHARTLERELSEVRRALTELRAATKDYDYLHGTSCGEPLNNARERLVEVEMEADHLIAALSAGAGEQHGR